MSNEKIIVAFDSLEKKLKDEKFIVERSPEIRDAKGDLHKDWVDLKAEYDSGMFKRILLHRYVTQPTELERARQELCQAAQYYRAKEDYYKLTMVNCMLILRERKDYPVEKLDELRKTCCTYQFADDICRNNEENKLH